MPFQKVQAEKLSIPVVRQIESLILRGVLRPGERLPAERDLSDRLGVSRPSLREALAELEARDLLVTRPGSGVYVAEVLGSAFSPPLIRLFATHDEALFDYLSLRRDLESLAAERAARLAGQSDLDLIRSVFSRMEAAHDRRDPEEEAALDADFHLAITEASHNVMLLHMMRSMFDLLKAGVFTNRKILFSHRTTRATLLDQHRAILDAVTARDPAGARAAVEAHLDYVESAMREQRRQMQNDATARLKLAREKTRTGQSQA
jgi:GntR family transcriptional repressor for pyruvate dehydrogenase complex